VWPADRAARALARAISSEMHAGFGALRNACPMNLGKRFATRDRGEAVAADAARITALWRDARVRFGGGGPFLFGAFSAADAMYAPVVTRFETYGFAVEPEARAYMDAILSLPSFGAWREAALQETWTYGEDEVDEAPLADFRAAR
jgi:glutathione S-transferase